MEYDITEKETDQELTLIRLVTLIHPAHMGSITKLHPTPLALISWTRYGKSHGAEFRTAIYSSILHPSGVEPFA